MTLSMDGASSGTMSSRAPSPSSPMGTSREAMSPERRYHSYDELPLFLNAELVAKVLGVSISSAYELMHEEVFPSVRIGSRFVVPKDKFQQWVERQTGGAR